MIFSDRTIKQRLIMGYPYTPGYSKEWGLVVSGVEIDDIQPASIDLHLDPKLLLFDESKGSVIDPDADNSHFMREVTIGEGKSFILHPGDFINASTREWVEIPEDVKATVDGKSSRSRLGLAAHITAGFIDPGFKGNITLEIKNVNKIPIMLRADMKICQISFVQLTTPADRPYGSPGLGSKYQGQEGVTGARASAETQKD